MRRRTFERAGLVRWSAMVVSTFTFLGTFVHLAELPAFGDQSVVLSWSASPGSRIGGYIVHCGVESGDYQVSLIAGNATNTTVWGLREGATYFFAVTAYNIWGVEGELSNEVFYSVPSYGITNSDSSTKFLLSALSAKKPKKSVLRIKTNGDGAIVPDLDGRELVNGNTYTMTAKPGDGQVFAGWSGGAVSPDAKLKFVMRPGLIVEASFLPNPFIPVTGNYTGLFYEKDEVRVESSGLFNVTVTSRGTFSAGFQIGKERLAMSGQLDGQLHAAGEMKRKNGPALSAELYIPSDPGAAIVSGTLTGINWTADLLGDRAASDLNAVNPPFVGDYTVAVRPSHTGLPSVPDADGFGTVRVSNGSKLKFAGVLSDGTKVNQSVTVSSAGTWPLFVPLYSGKGLVLGWVNFQEGLNEGMQGALAWIKSTGVKGVSYSAGFTNDCSLLGSLYTQPVGPTNFLLQFANATLSFTGGNLPADFANTIALDSNGHVSNLSENPLTMSISLPTGTFKGSATDPSSGKKYSFSGSILQNQNIGTGFMLVTDQASRVLLTPQ